MAGLYGEDVLAEVRSRNDIVDVISGYVTLKRKGTKYWGLCPFHSEKTPSFSVSPDKQLYYCFGCQSGGSVFNFIMNIENMGFAQSVEFLAERAGIHITKTESDVEYEQKRKKKERILEINRQSAKMYHAILMSQAGGGAREYLKNRGVADSVIKEFGLGYSPSVSGSISKALMDKGFDESELFDAALISKSDERTYEYFRDRIMFPIINEKGKVVAFGGRLMREGQPKYLNSPETDAFNKRQNLYGISKLKQAKSVEYALLVEGYMDVIALSAKGVENAVASLGTAFTRGQARLLKRFAKSVVIAYDADTAGQNATVKALEVLMTEGVPARVVVLPKGLDPDDFVKENGKDAFLEFVSGAIEPTEFKMDRIKVGYDLKVQKQLVDYVVDACKVIAQLESPIERDVYVKRLELESGFERQTIRGQIEKGGEFNNDSAINQNRVGNFRNNRTNELAQHELLSCMLKSEECVSLAKQVLAVDDFSDERVVEIVKIIWYGSENNTNSNHSIADTVQNEETAAYLAELSIGSDDQYSIDDLTESAKECCVRIRKSSIENKVVELKRVLSDEGADEGKKLEVLKTIDALNKEFQSL